MHRLMEYRVPACSCVHAICRDKAEYAKTAAIPQPDHLRAHKSFHISSHLFLLVLTVRVERGSSIAVKSGAF